jgi:Rieske Fe-S protein
VKKMRRRDFVRRLPVVTTGLALGAGALPAAGCAGAPYLVPRVTPQGLVVSSSSVPDGSGVFLSAGSGAERPLFLHRTRTGSVEAVLASCTHQGCQPEPLGDRLVCPCHGSEFTFGGAVLQGPAEEPLRRFTVRESGGEIAIATGEGWR